MPWFTCSVPPVTVKLKKGLLYIYIPFVPYAHGGGVNPHLQEKVELSLFRKAPLPLQPHSQSWVKTEQDQVL